MLTLINALLTADTVKPSDLLFFLAVSFKSVMSRFTKNTLSNMVRSATVSVASLSAAAAWVVVVHRQVGQEEILSSYFSININTLYQHYCVQTTQQTSLHINDVAEECWDGRQPSSMMTCILILF